MEATEDTTESKMFWETRIPDNFLMSAIGNSYGDIYETHLEWAKDSRMNKTPGNVPKNFHKHLMPILKGKL